MDTMPRRRKADFNEEHCRRLLQRSGVALIVSHGLDEEVEIVNDTFTRLFGYTMEDIPDVAHWWPLAYPDEAYREAVKAEWRARVARAIANQGTIESMEAKVRCKDGSERYIEFHFASVGDSNLVSFVDLTERKISQEALADMGRKLIAAQEQERARIGRELHDDINQRLGMLASELGKLQDNPSEVSRVKELVDRTIEIANDVQALSHELHAAKVEYLGAVRGLRSWCKEFGQRHGLEIHFTSQVSRVLPLDIGTCLFRILQEALHNAVKHSGAKRVEVQLREDSTEVSLIIHDSGRGFDVTAAMQGHGLGLMSMKERIRLVNGEITIQSNRSEGTTVHACVPFSSEHYSQRATG